MMIPAMAFSLISLSTGPAQSPAPETGAQKGSSATPSSQDTPKTKKPADDAAQIQQQRLALAAKVSKAHREKGSPVIDRFDARLTLSTRGKAADSVDIELVVKYAKALRRSKDAVAEMIRYSTNEGAKQVERGKDPRPWQRIGKDVHLLGSKDDPEAPRLLKQHTRLCRQMLQFLDPGAILRDLRGDTRVQTVQLRVGRGKKAVIEAEYMKGILRSFPIFRSKATGIRSESVYMEVWVNKKTGELAAVRVYPRQENGKPVPGAGEFIMLQNYARSKGVAIPRRLLIFADNGASREQRAEVKFSAFALNPDLTMKDFARPR